MLACLGLGLLHFSDWKNGGGFQLGDIQAAPKGVAAGGVAATGGEINEAASTLLGGSDPTAVGGEVSLARKPATPDLSPKLAPALAPALASALATGARFQGGVHGARAVSAVDGGPLGQAPFTEMTVEASPEAAWTTGGVMGGTPGF